jgi:hypothetical protein
MQTAGERGLFVYCCLPETVLLEKSPVKHKLSAERLFTEVLF